MDESNILIIGSNGQLGKALVNKYRKAIAVDSNLLDITNVESLADFNWSKVSIIINAAAYTNVDGAETPEGRIAAWKVNAVGVANLAQIAMQNNLTLIHFSSDYVFDGTKSPHKEDEDFSPLGVYGQSKAAGDISVSLVPKNYILRTSWVIGDGKNFVRTMLGLGGRGISPTVVADQIGRLTFTNELVRAIEHLLSSNASYGTYNVSNDGKIVSWADITRKIFELAGYDLTVTDTTTEEYFASKPHVAPRPLNSALELAKLNSIGFSSIDWEDNLIEYINKELA